MDTARLELGKEALRNMMGDNGELAYHQMKQLDPEFATILIGLFGEFYSRPGLEKKQKALVTITTLITQGALQQLRLHTRTALHAGLTPQEIIETAIQCIPYIGFPTATNALQTIKEVLQQVNASE